MKKGFTLVELLVVILIIAILIALLLPVLNKVIENGQKKSELSNLKQLGLGMIQYVQDFGDNTSFPDTDGGGFLARIYQVGIIEDAELFLSPGTADVNNEGEDLLQVTGEETVTNAVSFSGRINQDATIYPGLFKGQVDASLTCIAASDQQPNEGEFNFFDFSNFLFLDGHAEGVPAENINFELLLDPLTN